MTVETFFLLGFGNGVGLQDGTSRYIVTLGFGPAEEGKAATVSVSQSPDVTGLLNSRSRAGLKPYAKRTRFTVGTAFNEVRE